MTFDTSSFFAGLATAFLPLVLTLAVSYGRFKQLMTSVIARLDTIDHRLEAGRDQDQDMRGELRAILQWKHDLKGWQQIVLDRLDQLEEDVRRPR